MIQLNKGKPFPLGSSLTSQGVNFSLIATNAEYVEILLFEKEDSIYPKNIFKLDQNHKTGPYWHAEISNLNEGCIYAFRIKQKIGSNSIVVIPSSLRYGIFFKNFLKQLSSL